nr:immunoglobulin heavy chain junction region [Mus musculus]
CARLPYWYFDVW